MVTDDGSMKVYLAGPFFNQEQLSFIEALESVIIEAGYELFSPRLGDNALEMNKEIAEGHPPSLSLRQRVFDDNTKNIDDADLMVAVVDDFDTGTIFEWGFAYRANIPIVSVTKSDYGCNLMLAQSIIAHVKSLDSLKEVLQLAKSLSPVENATTYAKCVAMIQRGFLDHASLKEGPEERDG